MKKLFYLLILCTTLIISCTDNRSLETVVESRYKKCDNRKDCIIDFSQALSFDWDYLYIFEEGITNEAVSKTIGFEYSKNKDLSRLILFVKNNKIVYEQNEAVDYDNPFKISFYSSKYSYPRLESKFLIENDKERNLYLLTPVNQ